MTEENARKQAKKIAEKIQVEARKEREKYHDIIMRGGNASEYGMRGDVELITDILAPEILKISRKLPFSDDPDFTF